MKKALIALLSLIAFQTFSQEIKDYKWQENPKFDAIPENFKDAPAVVLLDSRWIHIRVGAYAYASFIMRHEAIKIIKASAINDYNKVRAVNGLTRDVRDFHARIIKPNGKIEELPENKITETEVDKIKSIAFEGVEEGDIVEYYYILKEVPQSYDTEIFQKEIPILNASMKFTCSGINYDVLPSPSFTNTESKGVRTLTAKNIPGFKSESESRNYAHLNKIIYQAYVPMADSNTWCSFFKNKIGKFKGTQVSKGKSKNFIKDLNLNDTSKSVDERLISLDNYIKTNFEFKQEGEHASINKLSEGKQRVTSSEMLSLYGLSLIEMKIPFYLIASTNRFYGDINTEKVLFALPFTFIFYVPETKKYITPFDNAVAYGYPDAELQTTKGPAYDFSDVSHPECYSDPKYIPLTPIDFTTITTESHVVLKADKSNVLIEKTTASTGYHGQSSRGIVKEYKEESDKTNLEKFVNFIVLNGIESKLNDYTFENEEFKDNYSNKPFKINVKAETKSDFVETAGNLLLVNLGKTIGKQNNLYQETERQTTIDLQYTKQYHHKIVFDIPAGYKVENYNDFIYSKKLTRLDSEVCSFVSTAKIENQKLIIEVTEKYNDITYAKEYYSQYRDVINASADFNKASVVLKPL